MSEPSPLQAIVNRHMTPEEQVAARQRLQAMTPEERSALLTPQRTEAFDAAGSTNGTPWEYVVDLRYHANGRPYWMDYLTKHWRLYAKAHMTELGDDLITAYCKAFVEGKGLYLYGGTGTGKTYALAAMYADLMGCKAWLDEGVVLVHWLDLKEQLQADFGKPDAQREAMHFFRTNPVLLVDDIGCGRLSAWGVEAMLTIIEHRTRRRMLTYYSSNYSLKELGSYLTEVGGIDGERIASRIRGQCNGFHVVGDDRRAQ